MILMKFEEKYAANKTGKRMGYAFAYFLFTTILFFILRMSNKIPDTWSYFHMMGIVLFIALTGIGLKRVLR